jgi:XTP/dITP diphosphohydrolase
VTGRLLLLATRNEGKLRELRPIFDAAGYAVIDLREAGVDTEAAEDELESFDTFEENALAKAHYFFERTGLPCAADDSGLEVLALDGRPGVRSKRWAQRTDLGGDALDAANNAKLIDSLAGIEDRRARFVCAAAYVDATRELCERGETNGEIVEHGLGNAGFGYDPFFRSVELKRTFGESTLEEKARVSHRARAMRLLLGRLQVGN